jgi:hypothetical protein
LDPATYRRGHDPVVRNRVNLEGAEISIHGSIALPAGTLTSTSIAPFPSASIIHSQVEFTYVDSSGPWQASTAYTLGKEILDPSGNIAGGDHRRDQRGHGSQRGTRPLEGPPPTTQWCGRAKVPSYPPSCRSLEMRVCHRLHGVCTYQAGSVLLHTDAVQVITAHADGTQSVRPIQAAPARFGSVIGQVMLQFYASGVRDASEVHVQIAGQDVPVRYAGAAGHFPGLDEVTVEVPRSLAGMGDVDVVLTADGQTASPVRIHIQ